MANDDFNNIDFGDDDAPAPRRETPREVMKQTVAAAKARTTRVILEEVDEIPPVGLFVGVNGKGWLIKPGVPVDLPPEVLHVLNNAVQATPVIDPDSKQVTSWRERMRYPYRVVGPEAVAA